jgi:hypothetical protein
MRRHVPKFLGLLLPVAVFTAFHGFHHVSLRARFRVLPAHPLVGRRTTFDGSRSTCDRRPCSYRWTMKVLRRAGRKRRYVAITTPSAGHRRSPILGRRRSLRYVFRSAGTYLVRLTVFDRSHRRASKAERVLVSRPPIRAPSHGVVLPHDPSFVGPSYYSKFRNGPSSSMGYFPVLTYQLNLSQWSQLPARLRAMGINGVDDAYDESDQRNFNVAAASGLTLFINGDIAGRSNGQVVRAYAMQDEPNSNGSKYAASSCSPSNDSCGHAYVGDANAYRSGDPTRPVIGNFTKDVMDWASPPGGWSEGQFQQHNRAMIGALDIVSSDNYGWTDPYEWDQRTGSGSGHYGAWIYGHAISQLRWYDPRIPTFGFVECCDDGNSPPTNTMMPGMIQSAVWNIVVHGGRGYVFWTTDFYDANGDPRDNPYPGSMYYGPWALYGDHQWDAQYSAAAEVNHEVEANAPALNSPTVSGISANSSTGVPLTALGKDVNGKLWLLVQADGNESHPLSNRTPMTATIQLPPSVPAGTVLNVVGENRTITVDAAHRITDSFGTITETPTFSGRPITYGYQHHIYEMR